jgi:molybdate transport system ATP-binding protein
MSVARHVCTRYSLAEGKRTTVRLRGEGIHLMPLDGSLHVPTQ